MFCSGVDGSTGRAGQHGVGLAVKECIIREATWTQELTNERLMSITFNLTGKSNAVTFIVAYGPTDTVSNTREQKAMFWADLESAVSRVPSSDYLFVLIDANARTGVRMGEEDCCCCCHPICCLRRNVSLDTLLKTLQPGSQQ